MKVFKGFIVALILLILVAFIVGIVFLVIFVEDKWTVLGLTVGVIIIDLIFGISILVSNKYSDIKLCWMFFVLGVPIFGWICYAIFGNNSQTPAMKKKQKISILKTLILN